MRPLVVLLLVLGSLAALLFALTTLTDSERAGEEERGVAVAPVEDGAGSTADLAAPSQPAEETRAAAPDEITRQAVQPDADPSGQKVAFGAIDGIVVDEEGRPLAEARVNLFNMKPSPLGQDVHLLRNEDPPRPYTKLVTGPDGVFRFEQLDPRKDWSLTVSHARYLNWESDVAIPVPEGGVWPETVSMTPGEICSGVVRDAKSGQTIAGALLIAEGPFARMNRKKNSGRLEAKTDAAGAYVFENIGATPSQPRILTVTAPGYATQVHHNFAMTTLSPPPTRFKNKQGTGTVEGRIQDFELEPAKVIAGRVVGPEGRGMPGIEIEAMSQSGTISSMSLTESGANGEFLLEGLAEGIYNLRVTATNYDASPLQRVEAGDTKVVIELYELGVVTGKVVDPDGKPLTAFIVKARAANELSRAFGAVMAQRTVKDARDGAFELPGVPDGSYVLEASAPGFASSFSDTFTATQGLVTSDVIVRMNRGGSLRGTVVDGYGSTPVAGAEVATMENDWVEDQIFELFGALEPSAMTKAKVFTDAEGRFEVDLMTPGTYQVQIKARGYSQAFVKDVEVIEEQTTDMPPQVLIKGAVITGTVYGRDKSILPGATVQLYPSDPNLTSGHRVTRADGTGRFLIDNAQPGVYELSATRPNSSSGNPFEALADLKQSQIDIAIEDGGTYDLELHLGP